MPPPTARAAAVILLLAAGPGGARRGRRCAAHAAGGHPRAVGRGHHGVPRTRGSHLPTRGSPGACRCCCATRSRGSRCTTSTRTAGRPSRGRRSPASGRRCSPPSTPCATRGMPPRWARPRRPRRAARGPRSPTRWSASRGSTRSTRRRSTCRTAKPIAFKDGQEPGLLLAVPFGSRAEAASREDVDLLVGGSVREASGYFLVELWAWDAARGAEVFAWRDAATRGELYDRVAEAGRGLTGVLLGRPWASLEVAAEPPGASVLVDGKPPGTGRSRFDDLEPGSHEVRASAPGYREETRTVDLDAGERDVRRDRPRVDGARHHRRDERASRGGRLAGRGVAGTDAPRHPPARRARPARSSRCPTAPRPRSRSARPRPPGSRSRSRQTRCIRRRNRRRRGTGSTGPSAGSCSRCPCRSTPTAGPSTGRPRPVRLAGRGRHGGRAAGRRLRPRLLLRVPRRPGRQRRAGRAGPSTTSCAT